MSDLALNMKGIVKKYGGVPVLKEVGFSVRVGEIHALLGENGAGKTTLMNVLGGVVQMDAGEVELFGKPVHIGSTGSMRDKGVAFIHQELNVVNDLMVYENMFLGRELRTRLGTVDVKTMCEETARIFRLMQFEIDPKALVGSLDTSTKQIVEIARSLLMNARIILMDEPTTSLTQKEIDRVFQIMNNLARKHNVSIVFISHKLGEVVAFCDRYTVLVNGENVAEGSIIQEDGYPIDQADIARMMVGKDVLSVEVFQERLIGEPVLEVKNLSIARHVDDVSFTLNRGEVLGITGLLGDGKEQLVRSLFGDMSFDTGTITLHGKPYLAKHPAHAKKAGVGFLPSNRKENAIIQDLSIQSNITIVCLDQCKKGAALNSRLERDMAERSRDELSIKVASMENLITSLSGGNQQKAVLSKWLNAKPSVLILSNPTQGVDVGAKNEIYEQIMRLAEDGVSILITSGEAREIMKICDRVLVMYHGKIQGELDRKGMTEENMMILSTGGKIGDSDRSGLVCNINI